MWQATNLRYWIATRRQNTEQDPRLLTIPIIRGQRITHFSKLDRHQGTSDIVITNAHQGMKIPRPYNRYNVFFILERELLIQARKGKQTPPTSRSFNGYESLDLPPLPPRYRHLQSTLAPNWYAPGKQKLVKRKHNKSHGGKSFKMCAFQVVKCVLK